MVHAPEQMREELDEIHVDIGILFPDHLLKLPVITQTDYAARSRGPTTRGSSTDGASVERDYSGASSRARRTPRGRGARDRALRPAPGDRRRVPAVRGLDPLWGHRQYDPIYEAAQEADLPVLLHSVTVIHPVFPFNTHGFETEFGRHICSHTFSIMANLVHMITTGVPVRYPKLRIALTEAGVSWVPFLMQRLDKEYLERRREVPFLGAAQPLPQEDVRRHPAHRGAGEPGGPRRR